MLHEPHVYWQCTRSLLSALAGPGVRVPENGWHPPAATSTVTIKADSLPSTVGFYVEDSCLAVKVLRWSPSRSFAINSSLGR